MTGDVEGDLAQSKTNLKRLPKNAIVADILLEDMTLTLKLARDAGYRTQAGEHESLSGGSGLQDFDRSQEAGLDAPEDHAKGYPDVNLALDYVPPPLAPMLARDEMAFRAGYRDLLIKRSLRRCSVPAAGSIPNGAAIAKARL